MSERYLLKSGDVVRGLFSDDVPLGRSEDNIKAIGSNISIFNCVTLDLNNRNDAHCDDIQIIPCNDHMRYFGELSSDIKIVGGYLDSNGSMQGVFAGDGCFSEILIKNREITTLSDHDVSISGALVGCEFSGLNDKFGDPVRILLDNLRIGGGSDYAFFVSSFVAGARERYGAVKSDQEIDDRRGIKWRDDGVYVDDFDLSTWRYCARAIYYEDSVDDHLLSCADMYQDSTGVRVINYRLSEAGIKLIILNEGIRFRVYRDSKGLGTVGVGHLVTAEEYALQSIRLSTGVEVPLWATFSREEVFQLLRDDLARFRRSVNQFKDFINQGQFDALVSFAFNIGVSGFERSTVVRRIKQRRHSEVPGAMRLWRKPKEIRKRRAREALAYKKSTIEGGFNRHIDDYVGFYAGEMDLIKQILG